jgi:hypothetical protein
MLYFLRNVFPKVAKNNHKIGLLLTLWYACGVHFASYAQTGVLIPPGLRPLMSNAQCHRQFPDCAAAFPATGQAVCTVQLPSVAGKWLFTFRGGKLLFSELAFHTRTVQEDAYDSLYQAFVLLSSELLSLQGPPQLQVSVPFQDYHSRLPTQPEAPLEIMEWKSQNRNQRLALEWVNNEGGRYLRLRYADVATRVPTEPRQAQ